jgi:DNA processing protein
LSAATTGAQFRQLLAAFSTPANVLRQPQEVLARIVDAAVADAIRRGPDRASLQAALDWQRAPGHAILTLDHVHYPALLRESPDPPPVLYALGRLELLAHPALAIVGSRNASAQGMRNAESFARVLSAHGLCIVSGMALGIDTAAHRGALPHQGSSIAVLGCGIDVIYPRRNATLFHELGSRGLVLSEFPLATPPAAFNFPRRNRIIAGLSQGCLVVEAAIASGSLITARAAVDMGRDVFAIPGSIHSPLSKGCHHLIKQGAKLVDDAADVLEELGIVRHAHGTPATKPAPQGDAALVLAALGHDACDVDALAERSGIPVERVLAALMILELDALVCRTHQGHYERLD